MVARLSDGSWSAPSAIAKGGGGFGGQIGFELTDFVFILNDAAAVRTFSQKGSIALGGNVSIAAGPVGRNAEAAGTASLKGVAGIFSYSKTKGLFAGVSIEGDLLVERRDANKKLYNSPVTAQQLLEGGVRPPPEAEPLMRVLNSRVFAGVSSSRVDDSVYNDIPIYDERYESVEGHRGAVGRTSSFGPASPGAGDDYEYRDRPSRAATWNDPAAAGAGSRSPGSRANPGETFDSLGGSRRSTMGADGRPSRPTAPKPQFKPKPNAASLRQDQAVALFTFDAAQPGDLGFKKGEIITILKRTENATDWWTGRIGEREGIFPR